MKDKVIALEGHSMRDKLIIEGIAQHRQEDCVKKVKKFFHGQLKIDKAADMTLIRCHRFYNCQ